MLAPMGRQRRVLVPEYHDVQACPRCTAAIAHQTARLHASLVKSGARHRQLCKSNRRIRESDVGSYERTPPASSVAPRY